MQIGDGDDFVWRAVMDGGLPYERLKDGTLDALDVFMANIALDVRHENQYRHQKAIDAENASKNRR